MKKLVLALVLAAVSAPGAGAGGWATVGLSSLPPSNLEAGEAWPLDITVLQHGRTPLAGVTPTVRIRDEGGALVDSFSAKPTGTTGVYHTVVRFPGSGTYSYEVYDGFGTYGGAQVHTFKPVEIGVPGGSFPFLPVGVAAVLLVAIGAGIVIRFGPRVRQVRHGGGGEQPAA